MELMESQTLIGAGETVKGKHRRTALLDAVIILSRLFPVSKSLQ